MGPEKEKRSMVARLHSTHDSHKDLVYYLWKQETMSSIRDRISKKKRAGKRPQYIWKKHWKKLLAHWSKPRSIALSETYAKNRLSDPDGLGYHKHAAGAQSFTKIEYDMMVASDTQERPPLTEVVRKAYTRKDGTFIDKRAEIIVERVEQAAKELPVSDGSHSSGPPPPMINTLYYQKVTPNCGRVYGLGSIQQQSFFPNMRSHTSLGRALDSELQFSNLEKSYALLKRGQDVLLRAQGIDPDTLEPFAAPTSSSANTQPAREPVNLGDIPGETVPDYFDERG